MRRIILLIGAALLVAAAPFSAAEGNLFSDPVCVGGDVCAQPSPCVQEVACPPTACSVALECEGSVDTEVGECNEKPPSDGETCQTSAEARAAGTPESTGATGGTVRLALTDGRVQLENLPNTWDSSEAQTHLVLFGSDFGTISAVYYHSDVDTSNSHRATQYGASATWMNEEGSRTGAAFGVVLLDGNPELCFVHTYPELPGTDTVDCQPAVP